jgi:hypothetical protein
MTTESQASSKQDLLSSLTEIVSSYSDARRETETLAGRSSEHP